MVMAVIECGIREVTDAGIDAVEKGCLGLMRVHCVIVNNVIFGGTYLPVLLRPEDGVSLHGLLSLEGGFSTLKQRRGEDGFCWSYFFWFAPPGGTEKHT
jgi:hypothetical protein